MTQNSPAQNPPQDGAVDAPTQIDESVAHSPRIWNYWLGGKDNYAIDREIGDQFRQIFPQIVDIARASRAFLSRAVTYLADEAGVDQFLDIDTGLPTVNNTHEVAQRVTPHARVVLRRQRPGRPRARACLLLGSTDGFTTYIDADLRDPDRILALAGEHLDFDRPIALMLLNILGHIPDLDDARAIVARLVDALPAGSYLAVADGTNVIDGPAFDAAIAIWNEAGSLPYHLRKPEQIEQFFAGLEIVEPGVVPCSLWRPAASDVGSAVPVDEFGAVGRTAG